MRKFALLMILALCWASAVAWAASDTLDQSKTGSTADPVDSFGTKFTLVDINQFAKENPIDPMVGFLTRNAAMGRNGSVNLTQIEPGKHFGAHYHRERDEIDYIVKGQANMTIAGQTHLVKAGDLIYIPPMTVHDFAGVGDDNLELICIFSPPYDGKDRIYV
jgi:mannose-6-phosphate isomerase-like protein (cupin superfamily)